MSSIKQLCVYMIFSQNVKELTLLSYSVGKRARRITERRGKETISQDIMLPSSLILTGTTSRWYTFEV